MSIKTLVVSICFFLFSTILIAQDDSFSWGVQAYPNYSGRRLVALGNYSNEQIQEFEELETGMFGYSAGVMAEWKAEKLGIRLGLNYMASGYQTIKIVQQLDDPNFPTHTQFQYKSTYVEVPVEILFSHGLIDTKAAMFFMLGASFSYNLDNQTKLINHFGDSQTSEDIPVEDDFRAFNYAFQSGIGVEFSVSDRMTIVVQPNFQFWLKGLLQDSDINRNLYTVGLKTGVLF